MLHSWKAPVRPAQPGVLANAFTAGVVGAVILGDMVLKGRLGIGIVITAGIVALAVLPTAWAAERVVKAGRPNWTSGAFTFLALGLVSMAALRDAPWIAWLSLALSVPLASYALSGGRSWTEIIGGGFALPVGAIRMLPWVGWGLRSAGDIDRERTWPIARTGLIAAGLLAVFGALFAGADAAFRGIAQNLIPDIAAGPLILRTLIFAGTALFVLAAVYLTLTPPPLAKLRPRPGRPAGRLAWAIPLAALNLLFLSFVAVQATVLLAADKDRLLRSTGLSYAEYARQGFFQLVIATMLVLVVVVVAARHAPRASSGDRLMVRLLLGLLCALTLVVVAAALRRLFLYEEAYGWTRLRLWVHAFELWLGLVILLTAAAGFRMRAAWLPRLVAASGAIGLLALGLINPDAFIAARNVDRFHASGKVDVAYLAGLSADAVPVLDRLPEPYRSCALRPIDERLHRPDPAVAANLGRHTARDVLAHRPPVPGASCPAELSR
jgi:hypothetical protein